MVPPPAPEGYELAGKVYRILTYTEDGGGESTGLKQKIKLTMFFDPDKIPEGAEIYIVSYHPDSGWIKLDCTGDLAQGWLTAWVDYFDMVAVINKAEEPDVGDIEPDTPTVPAFFDGGEPSDNGWILPPVNLGVVVTGTIAMTVLTAIERRRRNRRTKLGDK